MKMSTKTAKPKDMKYVLKRLWKYLYAYKGKLTLALVLTLVSNVFALIGPKLSGYAVDAIEFGKGKVRFDQVFFYAGWMIVLYVVSSLFSLVLSRLMVKISQMTVQKMRQDVFEKLMVLPVGYFDQHQTGDIISRISYDIDTINTSLSTDLIQILASTITVAGSLAMMIHISPLLTMVMLITIPLSLFYTRYMTKRIKPMFSKRSACLGHLNGYMEERVSGEKTIKAYAREEEIFREFQKENKEAVDAYYNADYYGSFLGPSVNFINNLSLSLVTVVGSILFLWKRISLGNISSFVLYSRKFSGPINEAANIISELESACAAAERVFRLLDTPAEVSDVADAKELTQVQGDVKLTDVVFGYSEEKMIIKHLNLTADSGNMVAIVGPTGAGKTTIIHLLMRFYDVNSGSIQVDGNEIRDLTRKSLRAAYAMVLQDTWLFQGTVYENVAYGKKDATREEVIEACKAARIHRYIKRLPEGYDTVLSEDGINISKGQKQLLTIARAMLLDAKMLILDEATSNVDTRTEIQIQKAMRKLMEGKTCFIIAHRLSTIQNADCILVVREGNVVEQGNHKELMEKKGFYYQLYASQFE